MFTAQQWNARYSPAKRLVLAASGEGCTGPQTSGFLVVLGLSVSQSIDCRIPDAVFLFTRQSGLLVAKTTSEPFPPFDNGFAALQTPFTGTVAKVASPIAIVIGGYQWLADLF